MPFIDFPIVRTVLAYGKFGDRLLREGHRIEQATAGNGLLHPQQGSWQNQQFTRNSLHQDSKYTLSAFFPFDAQSGIRVSGLG